NAEFTGSYSPAPTGPGSGPRYVTSVDGFVRFHNIPVVANAVEFQISLQTFAIFRNVWGIDMSYAGAQNQTSFEKTAKLVAFQAFDANGNDVSSRYTFTLASGETIASGNPSVTQAPVAAIAAVAPSNEGSVVTFNGAGSTDADNDPLTYSWTFG